MCDSKPVTLTVGFKPARGSLAEASATIRNSNLKSKVITAPGTAGYLLFLTWLRLRAVQTVGREHGVRVICAGSVCRSVFYNDRILFCSNNRANSGDARPS